MKCPWCEEYIKYYLKDDGTLSAKELQEEKERLDKGRWMTKEEADSVMTRSFTLQEVRDKVLEKKLQHFWITTHYHSGYWTVPICCELVPLYGTVEYVKWEIENFKSLSSLTEKVLDHLILVRWFKERCRESK